MASRPQWLPIPVPCYPSGASQVAVEGPPRTIWLLFGINVQHDPGDLAPVRTFGIGIKHTHVCDSVLLIVVSERWAGRRVIGDIGIEGRHGCT